MKLAKARIKSFQSFADSGDLEFSQDINLIVGQNNAGKSALLRALLPAIPDDRHRTPELYETHRLPVPEVALEVVVSGAEIHDWVLRANSTQYFPLPEDLIADVGLSMERLLTRPELTISVRHLSNNNTFSAPYPSHGLFEFSPPMPQYSAMIQSNNGSLSFSTQRSAQDSLPQLLHSAWGRDMFYFEAERMTIGESQVGYTSRLRSNAANLPNVLHFLANEQGDVFHRLIAHLREIFPTVGNVSVRTTPHANTLEVRIWPTKKMERVELSFPLNSSGTGVSQVIALLTAIMTIDNAIVIIDEINSFLHPAAVKALLRIIQTQYSHHQYIITTHAPEVISFSYPKTIYLVKRNGYESSVEKLDLAKVGKLREVAEHLGVSMADVFAAERVIWVEGPTEELCFPYLYQQLVEPLPRGTIFTSVAATGDFNTRRRDPKIVYEVYNRLCAATASLVVSVAFSFDTEKLTVEDVEKMQADSKGLLHFLPRRHFECYLIDPSALAAFIVGKDPQSARTVTSTSVLAALEVAAATPPLRVIQWKGSINDEEWLAHVDAANLISEVCGTLSEQKVPFTKKDDSLFLLRHIIENDSGFLQPLVTYVKRLVN